MTVEAETVVQLIEQYVQLMTYILALGIALSILYAISDLLTKDKVLKIVTGKKAFVFIGNEVYYGKIVAPPRSGGGFEIFFPSEHIENPLSLLAFLLENYRETGDEKFLKEAQQLLDKFKQNKLIPENYTLEDIKWNPWAPPSLVSRKIFPADLKNLYAIIIFRDFLTEEELKQKWKELKNLYHPPLFKRISRKIYNSLTFVKDKITATISGSISFIGTFSPEIKKTLEDMAKKAITTSSYNPLLENSIGRLITLQVTDIDGEVKLYQGILREYSSNYIAIYDVDYRVQMEIAYKGTKLKEGYPKTILKTKGWSFVFGKHIAVEKIDVHKEDDKLVASIVLKNIHNNFIKVEKAKIDGQEVAINKALAPGETVEVKAQVSSEEPEIHVYYEICLEADIIWPISKVKIIGLGDYPPDLLKEILRLSHLDMLKRRNQ